MGEAQTHILYDQERLHIQTPYVKQDPANFGDIYVLKFWLNGGVKSTAREPRSIISKYISYTPFLSLLFLLDNRNVCTFLWKLKLAQHRRMG